MKERRKIFLLKQANWTAIKDNPIFFLKHSTVQSLWDAFKSTIEEITIKFIPTKIVSGKKHLGFLMKLKKNHETER